jgi:hypothetical protein
MNTKMRPVAAAVAGVVAIAGLLSGASAATGHTVDRDARMHSVATFTYLNAEPRTFMRDHGVLSAIDQTAISVTRADGVVVTLATSDETCVHVDGLPAELWNLVLGQDVVAVSDETGAQALSIRAGHPKVRRDRSGCGLLRGAVHGDIVDTWTDASTHERSWNRGLITALTPHRIRIFRPDGVSVLSHRTRLTRVVGSANYWRLRLGMHVTVVSAKETDGAGNATLIALAIRVHRR